jgi:hypothetical protein
MDKSIEVKVNITHKVVVETIDSATTYYIPGMKFDLIICGEVLTTYTIAVSCDKTGLSNKGKIFLVGDHHYVYEGRFVNSKCVDKITEKEFKILTKTDAGYFRKNG